MFRYKNEERFEAIRLAEDGSNAAEVATWILSFDPKSEAGYGANKSSRAPEAICVSSYYGLIRPGDWVCAQVAPVYKWMGIWDNERFQARMEIAPE